MTLTLKDRVLAMQAEHPDASSGWIAKQLDCRPEYVRVSLYRSGQKCAKNPTKTGRQVMSEADSLMKEAERLRRRADMLEAKARAIDL